MGMRKMEFETSDKYGNVDLGQATSGDIDASLQFVMDMKNSGWQLTDRMGQDVHRDPRELRNNQFQGKIAEFMVYRWLQSQGVETLEGPTIQAWGKGESDPGYDFEIEKSQDEKYRLEVKSGGETSLNLALEVQKWEIEKGYKGKSRLKYNVPKEKVHGGKNIAPSVFIFVSVSSDFDADNITATIASGKIIGGVFPSAVIEAIKHSADASNNVFQKGDPIFGILLHVDNYVWGPRAVKQRGTKFNLVQADGIFGWLFDKLGRKN